MIFKPYDSLNFTIGGLGYNREGGQDVVFWGRSAIRRLWFCHGITRRWDPEICQTWGVEQGFPLQISPVHCFTLVPVQFWGKRVEVSKWDAWNLTPKEVPLVDPGKMGLPIALHRLYGLRGIRFANPANSRDNRGESFSFLACSAAKTSLTTIPWTESWDLRPAGGREWGVLKTPRRERMAIAQVDSNPP